jgi:hypothetical protein
VACSGHGECVDDGETLWCECNPGYEASGLSCLSEDPADGGMDGSPRPDGDLDGGESGEGEDAEADG